MLVELQAGTTTLDTNLEDPQSLEIDVPEDPVMPLLVIKPKDTQLCQRGTYSTTFIAALFVIARSWKQPGYPITEEWIQKMWFINTMQYYSAIKNDDIISFSGK